MGTQPPSPKRGLSPLKKISAHVYCGETAGWIKMALGMEICLSLGDFVLNGDPARPLNFRPMFIIVCDFVRTLHNAQSFGLFKFKF